MPVRNQAAPRRTIVTLTEALGHVCISELTFQFPRAFAPLRPLAGGEGGARRESDGRMGWVAPQFGARGFPHLTPALSASRGREGDFTGGPSWTLDSFGNDGRGSP
jgi:hypothetical protein